jgi:hypothetical protein
VAGTGEHTKARRHFVASSLCRASSHTLTATFSLPFSFLYPQVSPSPAGPALVLTVILSDSAVTYTSLGNR